MWAGAILFNGLMAGTTRKLFRTLNIRVPDIRTYQNIQKQYLHGVSFDAVFISLPVR